MSEDLSWLDIAPSRVESANKLTGEKKRAKSMHKGVLKRGQTWASDGEYVYFRRKQANPATLERHNRFIANGDFKHTDTQDDVEIYKLMPSSPFKRDQADLSALPPTVVRRTAILAACSRDWTLFTDALEDLAFKIKNARYTDGKPASGEFAKQLWEQQLEYIFRLIAMRRGPSQAEIDMGMQDVRKRRLHNNRTLYLPA
jgi:hypothetical protein